MEAANIASNHCIAGIQFCNHRDNKIVFVCVCVYICVCVCVRACVLPWMCMREQQRRVCKYQRSDSETDADYTT